jgi:hypothetical protein
MLSDEYRAMLRALKAAHNGCSEVCSEGILSGYSGVLGGYSVDNSGVPRGLGRLWGVRWGTHGSTRARAPESARKLNSSALWGFESGAAQPPLGCEFALNPHNPRTHAHESLGCPARVSSVRTGLGRSLRFALSTFERLVGASNAVAARLLCTVPRLSARTRECARKHVPVRLRMCKSSCVRACVDAF